MFINSCEMISNGLQKYANYFDFANKLTKKTLFITAVKSAGFISSLIYDKIFHKKQGCRDEAFWS